MNESEFITLNTVQDLTGKINKILCDKQFNSATLKELICLYDSLYDLTKTILFKKNIADIYNFYFKNKEKALKYYLEYLSEIKNDSTVLQIVADIYKSKKDNKNYKKYLNLAFESSTKKIEHVIPNSEDLLLGINIGVAAGLSMNDNIQNSIETYNTIIQNPVINNAYMDYELQKANNLYKEKKWQDAMVRYKSLFNYSPLDESDFIKLITCLVELNQKDIAKEYLSKYEEMVDDKERANYVIADLLYFKFKEIPEAIERFERYIVSHPKDALTYNTLGHLYSEYYNDKFLDKSLKYFLKAYELNPNSKIFTKNVALIYSKLNDFENADKFYNLVLKINPTQDDMFDYGCFLIQNGQFEKGFEYFTSRFKKEDKPALYPPMLSKDKLLTDISQIKGKTILVQCEQGFGDSIMYSRFVKQLSTIAKKVIFIVQNELVNLFKNSDLGAEISGLDTNFAKLEYDFHVPIMHLPLILKTSADTIPYTEKYLSVNQKKYEYFKSEILNNNKNIKIGIAYAGHNLAQDLNRDIPLKDLIPIMKMKNVDIYVLQHEDYKNEINNLPKDIKIMNIGKDFSDFEDTAAAIENMDLVITTDNVILNLAGGLGKKTYAIFNKFTEYRWFNLRKDDVVWYKSVIPFQSEEFDNWTDTINQIKNKISLT